jgi:opacity protein-like surface antigen
MRTLLFVGMLLAIPCSLSAQEAPKAEVYGGYSFANLELPGARANANGWNASVTANFNRWFGLVTDFGGLYGASTSMTVVVPCTAPCTPRTFRDSFNAKVHTFLFGPQFSWRREKFTLFAHFLAGGARFNSTATFRLIVPPESANQFSSSNFAAALALGGGVDYKLGDRWAWRVQTDYLQSALFTTTQNNFRLSTGIVIRFGR